MAEQIWVLRAGPGARYAGDFRSAGIVAVGFSERASEDPAAAREETLKARSALPTPRTRAGQLSAFAFGVEVGDLVIVPRLPKAPDYLVGRVTSSYRYVVDSPSLGNHQRSVAWLGTFDQEFLSPAALNTLAKLQTIFRPTAVVESELRSLFLDSKLLLQDGPREESDLPSVKAGTFLENPAHPSAVSDSSCHRAGVDANESPLARSGTDPSRPSKVPTCPVCHNIVGVDSGGYVSLHQRKVGYLVTCKAVGRRKPRWKTQPTVTPRITRPKVIQPASTRPTVTHWIVLGAIGLFVVGIPAGCVAGNIKDGRRMDRAVAYACQSWIKAAAEHTSAGSSWAPDRDGLDLSELDTRVEAECGDSKAAWENWSALQQPTSPEPEPVPRTDPPVDQAECERSLAAMMDMDIDEQSRANNVDSIRIDCDMQPLQDDPFWQDAWQRHLEETGQTP